MASLVSAALSGAPDGADFRASFVPGRLDLPYVEVLSESKFTLFTASRTSLTQLAYSIGYNPFALRGRRVARIIDESIAQAPCGEAFAKSTAEPSARVEAGIRLLAFIQGKDAPTFVEDAESVVKALEGGPDAKAEAYAKEIQKAIAEGVARKPEWEAKQR